MNNSLIKDLMTTNSSIRAHENFSLSSCLLDMTNSWHQQSKLRSLGARLINFTCTPLTAFLDTIAHLALGIFTILGSAVLGTVWDFGMSLMGRKRFSVLRTVGGFINLTNALLGRCGKRRLYFSFNHASISSVHFDVNYYI